jgi:hypothetical protein
MYEELYPRHWELARLGGSRLLRAGRTLDVRGLLSWEEVATCQRLTCVGRASGDAVMGEMRERSIGKENNESFSS